MCCTLGGKKVSNCRLTKVTLGEDYSVKGIDILGKKPILQRKLMNKYVELFCNRHFKKKSVLGWDPWKIYISHTSSFT